jgi:hypothetical protein
LTTISETSVEDCAPFVYVSAGRLLLETDGEPPVTVESGEIGVWDKESGALVLLQQDQRRIQ